MTDEPDRPLHPWTLLWEREQQIMREQEALRRPYLAYEILGIAMVVFVEIALDGFWPLRLLFLPLIGLFVAEGKDHARRHVRGT